MTYQIGNRVLAQVLGMVFDAKIKAALTDNEGTRFQVYLPALNKTMLIPAHNVLRLLSVEERDPEVTRKRQAAQMAVHVRYIAQSAANASR